MITFLYFAASLLAASLIFAEKPDVCSGGHREIYPSITAYEKGDQYGKFIGPIYGKPTWNHDIKFPIRISQTQDLTIGITPTKEIYTLFAMGKVFCNGVQIFSCDEEDACVANAGLCPIPKCRPFKRHYEIDLKSSFILPGLYTGNITLYSYDQDYQKFHAAGVEFNMKIEK